MKKRVGSPLLAIAVVALVLAAACAPNQGSVAQFKQLDAASEMRMTLLSQAGEYYRAGILTDEQKDKILAVDRLVQQYGYLSTKQLRVIIMLEKIRDMEGGAVSDEELQAAWVEYELARAELRRHWSSLLLLIDPWLMEWIEKEAEKAE